MSILLTKVRPPQRRKDILRRVRLVDSIHQNLHRKLTFVSAPAGYGKTTLLIDFASDVDAIVCWYLISPDDNDLLQFVRHIVAAFQQQIHGFGKDLEELLNTPGGSPDPPTLAHELINEVERKVDDFCVLILDDYHLAGENEQVVDFIESLLEHLPDHLRILIGSRSVYGIPTANLYIRDELVTISADELRFRADEIQKLVLQNYHIRLPSEQAEDLANRADGWIVALLLALRSLENDSVPQISGATENVYTYLAEEVVNRQDPELRAFMYSTSIVSDFNEELCNHLLEREDSARLLKALEDRNLFVSRTETREGPSYRYHQLFAEFLYEHFAKENPKELSRLQERAASWYKQKNLWENAIRHKIASGKLAEAAEWMDEVASQFYTEGRQTLLAKWYEELQQHEARQSAPRLLLYYAKILIHQSQLDLSEELLSISEQALKQQKADVDMANLLVTRAMIKRFTGDLEQAESLARKAQGLVTVESENPDHIYRWSQAERILGIGRDLAEEREKGIQHLSLAIKKLEKLSSQPDKQNLSLYYHDLAETYTDLGIVHLNNGDMSGASRAFSKALDRRKKNRGNLGHLAIARNNIAYIYHKTGQYREAWMEYNLAMEHVRTSKFYRVMIDLWVAKGALLSELGEFDRAEEAYRQALGVRDQHGEKLGIDGAYLGLAEIERARGNFSDAITHLRTGLSLEGFILTEKRHKLQLGLTYQAMGQTDLALEQVDALLEESPEAESLGEEAVHAIFLKAELLNANGDFESATEYLREALAGVARLGYDQFLVVAGKQSHSFLEAVYDDSPSPQLKNFIDRIKGFESGIGVLEDQKPTGPAPSLRLEVQALGSIAVKKDGEILPNSVWRSNRARALFFYLIDNGKVRKEDVGLDFWPDFSPGKISSNFHATLWRVRQALGDKDLIVFEDDSYFLHPAIELWYDVSEYEDYLEQATQPNLSDVGRAELLRQAIRLYSGNYLTEVYLDWADERREGLQNSYIETLLTLAELERGKKRLSEAKDLYSEALGIDPFRDQIHLAYMKCLVESGSPSAAKAHFQEYRALLRKELNADPLPELQNFYEKLPI